MPPTPDAMETARRLLDDLAATDEIEFHSFRWIEKLPQTAAILDADEQTRLAVVRESVDRIGEVVKRLGPVRKDYLRYMNLYHEEGYPWEGQLLLPHLLRKKLPWTAADLAFVVNRVAGLKLVCTFALPWLPQMVNVVQRSLATGGMTEDLRKGLVQLGQAVERFLAHSDRAAERKLRDQLARLASSPSPGQAATGDQGD